MAKQSVSITVNGRSRTVEVEPDTPLLYVLRDDLELRGPKFGCGLSQCGACTVTLDGQARRSCVTPISTVGVQHVVTVEGLGTPQTPHRIQAAFIEEQAAQCGYCIPGMMMATAGLLASTPHPTDDEIERALTGNLCRCGTHLRILRAVKRAAGTTA
jgi:nicotinate dehydrogenase subunit A